MEFLKTLAPLLGSALGGPFGGIAASFIAEKLGVSDKSVNAVKDLLSSGDMTPDQVSSIRLAEIDFSKFMAANEIRKEELSNANVADARRLKIDTRSYYPELLSTMITVGFFGVLYMMTRDDSLTESAPMMIMLGSLGAAFGGVTNYWLGANKGSDRTKELLAQATLK